VLIGILLITYLLILSFSDIRSQKIPVVILKIGILGVLIWLSAECFVFTPPSERIIRVVTALLGALPGTFLVLLSYYSDKVGRGDGIVLLTIGFTESCTFTMILICLACICLALLSGILMCFRMVNGKTRMPYIPFVTGAYCFLKLYEGSLLFI